MRRLGVEKKVGFYNQFIGQTLDVLIEETRDKKTGLLRGISSNYIPVLVDAPDEHMNTIVHVLIEKPTNNNSLAGTIVTGV